MTDVKKCPEGMVYIPGDGVKVDSSGFCMDRHEVTNAEYSTYRSPKSPDGFDGPNQPVVNINWWEPVAFCKSQDKRLPTEAEWEKAARGPEGYDYGTRSGTLNHDEAHYDADRTADVCSYPENGYGLCDMTGNVWEYAIENGPFTLIWGGSWSNNSPRKLRADNSCFDVPVYGDDDVGFRCAADPLYETDETSQDGASLGKAAEAPRDDVEHIKEIMSAHRSHSCLCNSTGQSSFSDRSILSLLVMLFSD